MISRIHSASVMVADQEAALDYYVNDLGWIKAADVVFGEGMRFLTVVPPGASAMRGGSTQLALTRASWRDGDYAAGRDQGITLATPDVETTYRSLKAQGVRFKQPISVMPWGVRATWFFDLDGNELFLVEE